MAPRFVLCLLMALSVAGCASDPIQRTGYEALANAGRRDCMKDPGKSYDHCMNRQSYDDYQRSRRGVR